jgi:lysine 2,3-aminomutase
MERFMPTQSKTLRRAAELAEAGLVPAERRPELDAVAARYAVAITPAVVNLIDPDDPDDPIARQFVPSAAELLDRPEEHGDPIGDEAHSPVAGIVHRYPDRVLVKVTHVCATYCRFCFRRETVGKPHQTLPVTALDDALAYIAARPEIWEVILTGGDPLVVSARRLRAIMGRLAAIDHVQVVRIHTRLPVVAPERVTPPLVRALRAADKATYVVLHANHARELTGPVRTACARLVDAGIPMLSQSVLLRGINDDAETLGELMRAFVACRIKPYYLHHADLARGTAHFRTTIEQGQALMRNLRGRYSGLCQPTYVLDIPGGFGKSPIGPDYLQGEADDYRVTDFTGRTHVYPLA